MSTLEQLTQKRIVTAPRGSWKWQDAYRVAEYRPRKCKNGRIVWESFSRSGKYSLPQLSKSEYADLPRGSLHNWPVSRRFAVSEMGIARVTELEDSGWEFGQ